MNQGNNIFLPPAITIPGTLLITNITQSFPMQVSFTNSDENTYITKMLVRLFIPPAFGMQQANGLTGQIILVDNISFIFYLNIDSTNFDSFIQDLGTVVPGLPIIINFTAGFVNLITALALPSNCEIVPTTVNIGFNANFYTDPMGNGILVGSPSGSGTINYTNGDVQFIDTATGAGTVFGLSYFPFDNLVEQPPSMSPAGSRNLQYNNFTNQVAFQNLNNTGN